MQIHEDIRYQGGDPLLVGGCVRDYILGHEPKDIDTEVYGMSADMLIAVLSEYTVDMEHKGRIGRVDAVGSSFGVIKLIIFSGTDAPNEEYDFSLPRRDNKTGAGHKGFQVAVDPGMTVRDAASRRDFTMNSVCARIKRNYQPCEVCEDGYTGDGEVCESCSGRCIEDMGVSIEIIDPFNGVADLKDRILRHTSDAFAEDPLRVLRGMQFAGRMGMTVATETARLAYRIRDEYSTLALERVWGEWYKWASKSIVPSQGLAFLYATKWVYLYPELSAMIGCEQEYEYHPEGTVWIHTQHTVDAAMAIAREEGLDTDARVALVFGALCHDMGKPSCTIRNEAGRIASPGHAEAGMPLAASFMRSIGAPESMVAEVVALTGYHMRHLNGISAKAARRLAKEMRDSKATTPQMVGWIMEADHSARPWTGERIMPSDALAFIGMMEEAVEAVKPLIQGRDLIAMGMKPGPDMGRILRAIEVEQVAGTITSPDDAKAMAKVMMAEV